MEALASCLAIDIGNTLSKAVHFEGTVIVSRWIFDISEDISEWPVWKNEPVNIPIVLSSVRPLKEEFIRDLTKKGKLYIVRGTSPVSFTVEYNSRETLGPDRLALMAGAHLLYPGKDLIVIDAGSCITLDLLTSASRYLGGSISPGIDMRLKAMHHYTAALPLEQKDEAIHFPGKTTRESIISGAQEGALFEMTHRIESLRQQYPELLVIVAGGDAAYFVKNLKNSIFASPDLVFQGLRMILNHYVRKEK